MTIHQQLDKLRERANYERFMCQEYPTRSRDALKRLNAEIRKLEKQADAEFQAYLKTRHLVGP